jgi:glyoxylase-like metal-dependent hydrolase (beta-lactamase superfamily II)
MAREHMMTWKFGDVEVTRIVEIHDYQDDIHMAMPEAVPEEVIAMRWLHPHYATPEGRMRMNFQAFVVRAPGRVIMIDTCTGNGRERDYDIFCNLQTSFLEDIKSLGIQPEDVDTVMCTHLHHDHVGWNTYWDGEKWAPTFPKARYLFGRKEYDAWQMIRKDGHHDDRHLVDAVDPIVAAGLVDYVEPDHKLSDAIWLEESHGHTPGHVNVRISSKGEDAVITGDLIHHPMQCAMAHRHATFDMDRDAGRDTRVRFVERYCDTDVMVIGTHFMDPTIGWIRSDAKGGRWFQGLGVEAPAEADAAP